MIRRTSSLLRMPPSTYAGADKAQRTLPTKMRQQKHTSPFVKYAIPTAATFTILTVGVTVMWGFENRDNPTACVNCKRQKEIAEEIYFGKKDNTRRGTPMG